MTINGYWGSKALQPPLSLLYLFFLQENSEGGGN